MMSHAAIREMSRQAAKKAAAEGRYPYIVWSQDISDWKATHEAGQFPSFPFPFIGDWQPNGWELVETHFVDSSGFGAKHEPALTIGQFLDRLEPDYGYAVIEVGQFQVCIGKFRKSARKAA